MCQATDLSTEGARVTKSESAHLWFGRVGMASFLATSCLLLKGGRGGNRRIHLLSSSFHCIGDAKVNVKYMQIELNPPAASTDLEFLRLMVMLDKDLLSVLASGLPKLVFTRQPPYLPLTPLPICSRHCNHQ